ncbi:A24 family peptidase [Streptomyces sp. AK02-01A]|uniref:A24 family peptidase n=1 Tax=Streptomyces sp. AK02-01A TaxID=3028648 RepID=UPI0029A87A90|nr:A24 family peptidase [Streptomyces sp. AK02-01A]MDX3851661.1 A24 family peptidase [Streptomyces sp. AK02-01A]
MTAAGLRSRVVDVYATLIVVAVLWGAVTGRLLPRAAYRLSVEPEDEWRDGCPAGHPITGPARGWLGGAGCATCDAAAPSATRPSRTRWWPGTGTGGQESPGAGAPADGVRVPYAPSIPVTVIAVLVCAALAASTGPRPELAVWLLLAPFALLLALVDRNVHRLPDRLTLPLAAAAAALLGPAALLPGDGGSWPTALLGGVVLGACYFALFVINPRGMGFGDVKLALSLGVALGWYGWPVLFTGAFAGFLLGSLYGLGLMLLRRASRKSAIPFGPFMILGALLGIVLGGLAAA